jgi:hypothetical protein
VLAIFHGLASSNSHARALIFIRKFKQILTRPEMNKSARIEP